jgi:hypothetical protein
MAKYEEAEAIRGPSQSTSQSSNKSKGKGMGKPNFKPKGKGKGKGKADTTLNHQATEDEEMEDAPMEDASMDDEQMVSLNEMDYELTNAGNTPTVDKGKGKAKNPVKFGELPIVGGKKGKEAQGKKDDDEEWKEFFLGR